MPVPDKKGPLTVLLLKWVKWQKNSPLSPTLLFQSLFHVSLISFYVHALPFYLISTLLRRSVVVISYYCDTGRDVNQRGLPVFCMCMLCTGCHILYLSTVLTLQINRSKGDQNTLHFQCFSWYLCHKFWLTMQMILHNL